MKRVTYLMGQIDYYSWAWMELSMLIIRPRHRMLPSRLTIVISVRNNMLKVEAFTPLQRFHWIVLLVRFPCRIPGATGERFWIQSRYERPTRCMGRFLDMPTAWSLCGQTDTGGKIIRSGYLHLHDYTTYDALMKKQEMYWNRQKEGLCLGFDSSLTTEHFPVRTGAVQWKMVISAGWRHDKEILDPSSPCFCPGACTKGNLWEQKARGYRVLDLTSIRSEIMQLCWSDADWKMKIRRFEYGLSG